MANPPLLWARVLDSIRDSITLIVLLIGAGLLLTWRLWRFSILPKLYPNEPKEAPYWIPCEFRSLAAAKIFFQTDSQLLTQFVIRQ